MIKKDHVHRLENEKGSKRPALRRVSLSWTLRMMVGNREMGLPGRGEYMCRSSFGDQPLVSIARIQAVGGDLWGRRGLDWSSQWGPD